MHDSFLEYLNLPLLKGSVRCGHTSSCENTFYPLKCIIDRVMSSTDCSCNFPVTKVTSNERPSETVYFVVFYVVS
jgi:hypothetical protein